MKQEEVILAGGNVSKVVRVKNTVRREWTENSVQIQILLKHLEKKNFPYSQRYLGVDEKGREIFSYIEWEAGNDPVKEYMWTSEVLIGIAKMLRDYHDATSDLPLEKWSPLLGTPKPYEVLCHNDFALYNIIFKDGKVKAIIDFDVTAPGPRIWDIAYTLYTCIPLGRYPYREETREEVDHALRKERIKLFMDSYNMPVTKELLDMVVTRLKALCEYMQHRANVQDTAFVNMIQEGHVLHYQKDIAYILEHKDKWL